MSSVFVVLSHEIESDPIYGIFTDKALAGEMAAQTGGEIEEWPLDLPPEQWIRWAANMHGRCKAAKTFNSACGVYGAPHYTPQFPNARTESQVISNGPENGTWINVTAYSTTKEGAEAEANKLFDAEAERIGMPEGRRGGTGKPISI